MGTCKNCGHGCHCSVVVVLVNHVNVQTVSMMYNGIKGNNIVSYD